MTSLWAARAQSGEGPVGGLLAPSPTPSAVIKPKMVTPPLPLAGSTNNPLNQAVSS